MATTVAAMKARLGDTDYFILSMKAKELVDKVTIPKDLEGWSNMKVEELYQRDITTNGSGLRSPRTWPTTHPAFSVP